MDRFTRTRIPARYSRYRHNTLDLHVLENVRSSLALYLPPSSLLQINIWGERERAPSCELDGLAVTIDIYIRAYVDRYCACAALRVNVAGRIGNRAESAGYLDNPVLR